MNSSKRKIFLILIATIAILSTYQFIDVCSRFRFLLIDIVNNITSSVVVFMIFMLLIAVTSYLAIVFNWKLLRKSNPISETNLIDEPEIQKQYQFGILHYGYIAFSGALAGFGVFLIIKPLQENYPINDLPNGLLPYFVAMIIIGLGVVFIYDALKIGRSIKAV